jgi:hypothetical protein
LREFLRNRARISADYRAIPADYRAGCLNALWCLVCSEQTVWSMTTMARRPEITGRKIQRPGKSVSEFCRAYGVSRATFYAWKAAGLAPATLQPAGARGWQLITEEAEQAWKARYTAVAAAIEAAG